jgi:hydrogenase-4 component B
MLLLAGTCVVLGSLPPLGLALVTGAARALAGTSVVVPEAVVSSAWTISLLALVTAGLVSVLWAVRTAALRRRIVRYEPTWGCGYDAVTPRMQYTASSFASSILGMFGRLSGARVEKTALALHTHSVDLVLDGVALPMWSAMHRVALRMRALQHGGGRLHFYLLSILGALLALLAYLVVGPRP